MYVTLSLVEDTLAKASKALKDYGESDDKHDARAQLAEAIVQLNKTTKLVKILFNEEGAKYGE
jgi:hypothetical protein